MWWAAGELSPTRDEYPHLVAGIEYWQSGQPDMYRVNPPLMRLWRSLPAVVAGVQLPKLALHTMPGRSQRTEFLRGEMFAESHAETAFEHLVIARRMGIPWILLGTLGVAALAYLLLGCVYSAIAAAWLYGLNPVVLGYGPLVECDVSAGCIGVWAVVSAVLAIRSTSWAMVCVAGVAMGLAVLTKFTWLIALPLWPLAYLAIGFSNPKQWTAWLGQCGLAILIVWLIVGLGYRGQRMALPLGDFHFISHTLTGDAANSSNRFHDTWLADVPVLLPGAMLEGIDQQWKDFDHPRDSYLAGHWKQG